MSHLSSPFLTNGKKSFEHSRASSSTFSFPKANEMSIEGVSSHLSPMNNNKKAYSNHLNHPIDKSQGLNSASISTSQMQDLYDSRSNDESSARMQTDDVDEMDVNISIQNILEMSSRLKEAWTSPTNSPKHDSLSSRIESKFEPKFEPKLDPNSKYDSIRTDTNTKFDKKFVLNKESSQKDINFKLSARMNVDEVDKIVKMEDEIQDSSRDSRRKKIKRLRVHTSFARNHVVFDSIRSLKWYTTDNPAIADIMWVETTTRNHILTGLISNEYHKVSRFPGMQKCVSKHHMAKHLERMRRFFDEEYSFVPKTFLFPDDLPSIQSLDAKYRNSTFVVKPSQGSQGNGIFLTQNIKKSCMALESKFRGTNTKYVIQEYLENPYLLEGYKFDLRIYVLIESISPLKIYVYDEGLTRFCTESYTKPNPTNLDHVYMHLSNYSLNKYNENFVESDDPTKGSKRNLAFLFSAIRNNGDDPNILWERIQDQIVKTCIAISPDLKFYYRSGFQFCDKQSSNFSQCFQLLGFDFFVDQNLKPWLIELNHHPSLTISNPVDEIKRTLVCRAMKVVAFDILYRNLPDSQKEEKRKRYLLQYCKGWNYIPYCDSVENARLQIFSLDQLIDSYIISCGPKISNELGFQLYASRFYKFARDAGLLDSTLVKNPLSRVQLDLLFIEINKKNNNNTTTNSTMAFDQFLDAVVQLSLKMYSTKKGKLTSQEELKCFLTFLSNHILNSKFKADSPNDFEDDQYNNEMLHSSKYERIAIKKRGYTSQTRNRESFRKDLHRQKTFVF